MNIFGPDFEKLDAILRQAYRAREEARAGTRWQDRVMERIEEAGRPGSPKGLLPGFGQLVWRLAPVTSLLALLLLGLMLTLGDASADPLQHFLSAAEESALARILGV
jgi:hypothetical protein